MKLSTVRKYRKKPRSLGALLERNPVLVLGLDLPFVIATATTLKNAAAMSLEMLLIHVATMLFAMLTCRYLTLGGRMAVNVVFSTIVMVFARMWITTLFPGILNSVGMYIYLMSVNGMTMLQAGYLSPKAKLFPVLSGAVMNSLAFAVIMFVVSLVRESFGYGTLWGIPVAVPFRLTGMTLPFFGFILMGFLLALARFINKKLLAFNTLEAARRDSQYAALHAEH